MTKISDFARAQQAFSHIDTALALWGKEHDDDNSPVHNAGWDALACAHAKAVDEVGQTVATSLHDIAAKAAFIATLPDYVDVIDEWAMKAIRALADDLARLIDRPTQDAFAVKLRAYQRAIEDREQFEKANRPADDDNAAWTAYEDALAPLHDAVSHTACAVMLEPAPDAAALAEKRRVFVIEEMQHIGDSVGAMVDVLIADGLRLAGGEA
ncbi:hypothetical protein [Sphingopyxis sp.]|uniref:hypothetical protein n=1 Tax=Sphingopyxis sp. TaxID=1908224 RepID=UPI00258882A6|nr:hypothetical protein [Sphingopyxis sp.]